MATNLQMNPQVEQIHGQIRDHFRALANGFQKLDKIKDSNRQSKQLEELTGKMKECKSLIREFEREIKDEEGRNPPEVNKQLNDEKQSMIKELNSYVALRKTYMSTLGNKKVELFDTGAGPSEPVAEENVQLASEMSNQELINAGMKTMDETDQAIERSKKVVHETIEVGTNTATTIKSQTEQMSRIVNELDSIQFSIKKASKLVKEIGRKVATDKCIMLFLFLIVCGVVVVIVVKIVNPHNKDIRDIPGLAPPAQTSRLLYCMLLRNGKSLPEMVRPPPRNTRPNMENPIGNNNNSGSNPSTTSNVSEAITSPVISEAVTNVIGATVSAPTSSVINATMAIPSSTVAPLTTTKPILTLLYNMENNFSPNRSNINGGGASSSTFHLPFSQFIGQGTNMNYQYCMPTTMMQGLQTGSSLFSEAAPGVFVPNNQIVSGSATRNNVPALTYIVILLF
ncbi:putative plant SNARE [Trifolium repens]|nr:putative plant SNARE [Trifolium repens]